MITKILDTECEQKWKFSLGEDEVGLIVLRDYLGDGAQTRVYDYCSPEVIEFISHFDCKKLYIPEAYKNTDLKIFADIAYKYDYLWINDINFKTLAGIENFYHVNTLILGPISKNIAIDISQFRQLEDLFLNVPDKNSYPEIGYSDDFLALPNLRKIELSGYKGNLDKLKKNNLFETMRFTSGELIDINGISNCQALTELHIENDITLSNIEPLQNLASIKKLTIIRCENIIDYSPVAKLTNLEFLLVGVSNPVSLPKIENINWISEFTNLTSLSLVVPVVDLDFEILFSLNKIEVFSLVTPTKFTKKELEILAQKCGYEFDEIKVRKRKSLYYISIDKYPRQT